MRGALSRRRLQQGLKKHEFREKTTSSNHFASWFSIIYIRILEYWNIRICNTSAAFFARASSLLASPVYGFSSSRANLPRPSGLPPSSLTPPRNHPFPKPHKHTHHITTLVTSIKSWHSQYEYNCISRGGWGAVRDTGAAAGEANVAEGLGVDPPPPLTRGGWVGGRVVATRRGDTR